MAWSITPTDATIDNDGVANFPPNTTSADKPYTITYTDNNGCTATTTYTVTPTSVCSCSNISTSYTSHSFNATGGTITAATITSPCTTSNFTVSDVPSWLTTGTTSNGITLTASENTGLARPTATIKFMLNGSTQCFTMNVSQKAASCQKFEITKLIDDPCRCKFTVLSQVEELFGCVGDEPSFIYTPQAGLTVTTSRTKSTTENIWTFNVTLSRIGQDVQDLEAQIHTLNFGDKPITIKGCTCPTPNKMTIFPEFMDDSDCVWVKIGSITTQGEVTLMPTSGKFSVRVQLGFNGSGCGNVDTMVDFPYNDLEPKSIGKMPSCTLNTIDVVVKEGSFVQDCVDFTYEKERPQ